MADGGRSRRRLGAGLALRTPAVVALRVGEPEAVLELDRLPAGRYLLQGDTERGPFSFPREVFPETRELTLSLPE